MVVQKQLYTSTDFWQMTDTLDADKRYELINGEIVEMPPPNRINSLIAGLILTALNVFIKEHKIEGFVFGADGGYALSETDVRIPDVSFVYKSRMPDISNMDVIVAPDLAVEVISQGETPRMINDKTALYLNAGTRIVWNVFPDEKVVEVWTKGRGDKLEMQPFTTEDTLDGGDVLPGFTLSVAEIFQQILETE